VIGDSITVGARDHLSSAYPEAVINAETGRRFDQGIRELTTMLEQADRPDVLVYALGTNNGATPEQIEQVVDLAAGIDRIVFVNVAVPRGWETDTNAALDQVAGNLGNVAIVDWHTTVGDDSSLLRSDGYHPNADGAAVWADLIIRSIAG
jgi:lysophospholipase L1-like esterase